MRLSEDVSASDVVMMFQDFDLCVSCHQKSGHEHPMEKLGLDIDEGVGVGGGQGRTTETSNPQEARRLSIQRCIASLVHACQCRDANCRLPSCQKMKRVMAHTKQCKRKTNGGCPVCKQLIALCCYHAKHCPEVRVPRALLSDDQTATEAAAARATAAAVPACSETTHGRHAPAAARGASPAPPGGAPQTPGGRWGGG